MSGSAAATLGAGDYAVFGVVLGISSVVGIYYAIQAKRKANKTVQYLAAPRKVHFIPVALSLTVSFMSAITILGNPAEIYLNGLVFWWLVPSFVIAAVIVSEIYIPLYYRLEITSSYEYLEMRFNIVVRMMVTAAFIIETIMYAGIVIYAPALALSQVTGFNLWAAVVTTGLVCTFYTTLGGLKGVIWSDVFQIIVMITGLLAVIIRGSVVLDGFSNIWQICKDGGRLNMGVVDPDPKVRHSLWSLLVGGTFLWLGLYAVSQSQIQRYLCCRNERESKCALYLNALGLLVIISLTCMTGLVAYAYFYDCDPFSEGKILIRDKDRLLPYLVMEILAEYPGVPGIFVACVFSGGLSTLSTGINAMACVTVEDFIKPFTKWSDKIYGWVSRGLGVLYGLLCIAMAYIAHELGASVLQAAISIFGIVGGPLVGVFSLGILFPFANSSGAIAGLLLGLSCTSWMYSGALDSIKSRIDTRILNTLPRSKSGCLNNTVNTTTMSSTVTTSLYDVTTMQEFDSTTPFETRLTTSLYNVTTMPEFDSTTPFVPRLVDFYSISYLYYGCVGFFVTLVIGVIFSLITCGWSQRKSVEPKLLRPFFDHYIFRSWLPESVRRFLRFGIEWEDNDQEKKNNINKLNTISVSQMSYENTHTSEVN